MQKNLTPQTRSDRSRRQKMMQKKKHADGQIAERIGMYRCSSRTQNIALDEKPQNELEYIL